MAEIPFNDHRFRSNQQPKFVVSSPSELSVLSHNEELVGQIHQAVRKTKSKITNLKQEVEKKDREAKRERAMRRAVERREQDKATEGTYVDPYAGSSPSINEELKNWLSPAAQRKRLLGRGNSPPERKDRTPPQGRGKPRDLGGSGDADGQEHLTVTDSYYSSEEERGMEEGRDRRPGRERRRYDDNEWRERSASYARRRYEPPAWYGDYGPPPPPHPAYPTHNPWISPHRVPPMPVHHDPRLMHTIGQEYPTQSYPHPQHTTSTPNPQRRHSDGESKLQFNVPTLVIPTQVQEGGQGDRVAAGGDGVNIKSSPSAPQQIPVTLQIQQSPDTSQHQQPKTASPQAAPLSDSHAQKASRLDTSYRSETVSIAVGSSPQHTPVRHHFDEQGLPLLLDELGAFKDKNNVLSEKVHESEKEIENLQLQLGVKDAMSEAEIAAKGAALIEEIYTAQREHDEAILARMKLANDERDDAFTRLQRHKSKDGFDSGTDVNSNEEDNAPDSTINNLLSRLTVADNRSAIDKYGSAIVGRIAKTKGRRDQITSEEMRAILKEKDYAMAKCKKLEREVIELRKNRESSKSRNNNEKAFKAQLGITRDERDKALVAVKKLKEENDSLKMYYSLHRSLSQEADLRDQFNNTLGSIEEQVKSRDEVLARTQHNNSQLAAQVRTAHDERNKMVAQLQRSEQDNQQLKGKLQQLERLVGVLRKKVAEGTVKTV